MSAGPLEGDLRGRAGDLSIEAAFAAPAGEITALFGPSGSGKTTLLRAAAGLGRLAGRLDARGTPWQDDAAGIFLPPHRRSVGFVFQQPALFAHLPVEGNLRYAIRRSNRGGRRAHLRFEEVVEQLGLEDHLQRTPAGLSGGELQRAELGRALLSGASVLLLDEPLSALHEGARAAILPWLRSVAGRSGIAVLYVTHDAAEVAAAADRIVLLRGGRVRDSGPAEAIFERLGGADWGAWSDRTIRFEAGSLLTARLVAHRTETAMTELDLGGQRLLVPAPPHPGAASGDPVRLRIRARDVALATRRPEAISVRNILEGVVAEVRSVPAGPFAEVLVEVGAARLRARLTRAAVADLDLAPRVPVFALLKSVAFDEAYGAPHPGGSTSNR